MGFSGQPVWILLLGACSPQVSRAPYPRDVSDPPTWHGDVAPLIGQHCVGCHAEGSIAEAYPWQTYEQTWPWAQSIVSQVAGGSMPPFGAAETEACAPRHLWVDDSRLTEEEVATLARWAEANTPLGDLSGAPAVPEPERRTLAEWDVELAPEQPYVATRGDVQVCFALDPGLEEPVWLKAVEVVPGDPRVVHHVQVRIARGRLASEEDAYVCTGSLEGEEFGAYLPGTPPMELPRDVAMPLAPGDIVSMQVHYHVVDGEPHADLTRLRLAFTEEPAFVPRMLRVGNDAGPRPWGGLQPDVTGEVSFLIPAGAVGHEERFLRRFDEPGQWAVFAVANHMHYAGAEARLWIERDGVEECLLHTPRWDFDWQQIYRIDLDAGGVPVLSEGDELWLSCTYDNSTGNEALMEQLAWEGYEAPLHLELGPGALNEMCAALVGVIPLEPTE